jgi:hypothetical protein
VAVSWYDKRGLRPRGKGWNVRLRVSADGGVTWLPSVRINDVEGDKGSAEALGHTAGLAADAGGTFHPVWIDFRTGTPQLWTDGTKRSVGSTYRIRSRPRAAGATNGQRPRPVE